MITKEGFDDFFGSDMDNEVTGFFGDYRFLSNFHLIPLKFNNVIYPSVEHAYQAAKSIDKNEREKIRQAETPAMAQKMGQTIKIRDDWNTVKIPVMEALLRMKFQDTDLRQRLIDTHPKQLIETNWWKDTFWGVYKGKGKNMLGILLMKIRDEFIKSV